MSKIICNLIEKLSKLPSIGSRSATRIAAFCIQNNSKSYIKELVESLSQLDQLKNCKICNNVDLTLVCTICSDQKRNEDILCIVSNINDLWSLEKANCYKGVYYIMNNTNNDNHVDALIKRINTKPPKEIILALNYDIEGEALSLYIKEEFQNQSIKISRLAQGIPFGGNLEYLDTHTIQTALNSRIIY